MRSDEPLSDEAKAYMEKLFPCITEEFPNEHCDSYGVCQNCCEAITFQAGYNFGYRAAARVVAKGEK